MCSSAYKEDIESLRRGSIKQSSSIDHINQQYQAYTPLLRNLPYRNPSNNPSKRTSFKNNIILINHVFSTQKSITAHPHCSGFHSPCTNSRPPIPVLLRRSWWRRYPLQHHHQVQRSRQQRSQGRPSRMEADWSPARRFQQRPGNDVGHQKRRLWGHHHRRDVLGYRPSRVSA